MADAEERMKPRDIADADRRFMLRAIELAAGGSGWTNPNPLVGAVIVKDGRIIGEGCHERCGDLHAERNALGSCVESPRGATAYVTLEPCSHHGRQPPCADALIEAGIARVVVGSRDPNPLVHGRGNARLRAAGIRVDEDVLRRECDRLNPIFFHFMETGLPFVVAKWAMTADGHISACTGDSRWVSCEQSRLEVHELRHRLAAIMVGINTVLADDPSLTCRRGDGALGNHPLRVVCDSRLRIPLNSRLVRTARDAPVLVCACRDDPRKVAALRDAGASVELVPADDRGHVSLRAVMELLGARKIDSVLLEGGGSLNASAFAEGLVNEAIVYVAPKIIGGAGACPVGGPGIPAMADAWKLGAPRVAAVGRDVRLEYPVNGSPLIDLYPAEGERYPLSAATRASATEARPASAPITAPSAAEPSSAAAGPSAAASETDQRETEEVR